MQTFRYALTLAAVFVTVILSTTHCGSGDVAGLGADDGGAAFEGGDASLSGDARDSGKPPPADAPFACGTSTCRVDQYCVVPCCGGAPPQCNPIEDAGDAGTTCPIGFHLEYCPRLGAQGCMEDPCKPQPPKCIDDPATLTDPGCSPSDSTHSISCVCA
jgi:hypothetical protein